jgi:Spy/CpxP family protein refolding chaperone
MRDSTVHAFKAVNRELLDSSETEAVSPAVANATLSETVALLIESWSRMTPRQKAWLSTLLQAEMENWN